MSGQNHSCGTCQYAEWLLTPTGRIKRGFSGRCAAEPVIEKIPASVVVRVSRHRVTPDMGADCWNHTLKE